MRTYRLITGNRDYADRMNMRPIQGTDWRMQADTDEDGKVPDNRVRVSDPDGVVLYEGALLLNTRMAVEAKIRLDVQERRRASAAPQDSARPPLICVRTMPTGGVLATLWLSGEEFGSSAADDSAPIQRGPNAMADLRQTVSGWLSKHPGAVVDTEIPLEGEEQVAAAVEPAKIAPDEAKTGAQAAREFGQALQEPGPPTQPETSGETVLEIPIGQIAHFPGGNVRTDFRNLEELAESIRSVGIQQPLTVNERDGRYRLVAGERRLRAAGLAGRTTVPCLVKHMTDEEALEWMLVENIQRQDLNPMEEARAYQRLLNLPESTQVSVAKRVGKSRPHVNEMLQLLQLPANLQGQVTVGSMAVKAALQFLRETRAVPDVVREKLAEEMEQAKPSIRGVGKVIDRVFEQEGVARATSPKEGSVPETASSPPKAVESSTPPVASTSAGSPVHEIQATESTVAKTPGGWAQGWAMRRGDPLSDQSLQVASDLDGGIRVSVTSDRDPVGVSVTFFKPENGGTSPRTLAALHELMTAMAEDNG